MMVMRLSASRSRSTVAARMPATPLPMITWCWSDAIAGTAATASHVLVEDFVLGDRDAFGRTDHVAGAAADALVVVDPDGADLVPLIGLFQFAVAAVLLDLDAAHQLDAVARGDLDAGPAIDAVVRIDLVLVVAEIAALGLLHRQILVVALLRLQRERVEARFHRLHGYVLRRDEVPGAIAPRLFHRLDLDHQLAPLAAHQPGVHLERGLAPQPDRFDHGRGADHEIAGGEQPVDRGHAALVDLDGAPAVELDLEVEEVIDGLLPDRDQKRVARLDELRAFDRDRLPSAARAPAAEAVLHELDPGEPAMVVGDQPHGRAQAQDLGPLALGLEDLLPGDRDVLLGRAHMDGDVLGPKAKRDARAVEGGEAGADHGDPLAHRLLLAAVQLHQEIKSVLRIREPAHGILCGIVDAAQRQADRRHAAGRQEHGVVLREQAGQPHLAPPLADRDAGAHIDAEAQRIAHLYREHVARQPELRDAVVQHAARDLLLLEDGHVVAEHGQIVRGRDARGAGADDRDALARGGEQVLGDAVPARLVVGGGALQMADVDRRAVARPAVPARVLARARADPAERAGQDVGDPVELVGAPVAVLQNHLDVRGHVGVRGAGALAGDVLAHPADVARIGRIAYRGDHPAAVGLPLGEVFVLVEIDLADLFAGHGRFFRPASPRAGRTKHRSGASLVRNERLGHWMVPLRTKAGL